MNIYDKYIKDRPCPKCGEFGMTTHYNQGLDLMERTCRVCGYETKQLPLSRARNEAADAAGGK